MEQRRWYPVFLDIAGKRVLVVGGGKVALRKTRGLLEAGAHVTAIAPRFLQEFDQLPIERRKRLFEDADLAGAALVFAATDSRDVNHRVAQLAAERSIPANIADAPRECAFIVPARITRPGLQIAVSTGGRDPARAARIRKLLEHWIDSACDHEDIE